VGVWDESVVVRATLSAMTAKEKLHERVEALSEEEAERLMAELEGAAPGDIVDEWGNLSVMTRASSTRAMRRLDEEERAERGETIGEAWEREGLR
jgi:hypothetical protein